ncbi:MAG: hypothetical protein AAGF04_03635 [Chlamydiota bacterium]
MSFAHSTPIAFSLPVIDGLCDKKPLLVPLLVVFMKDPVSFCALLWAYLRKQATLDVRAKYWCLISMIYSNILLGKNVSQGSPDQAFAEVPNIQRPIQLLQHLRNALATDPDVDLDSIVANLKDDPGTQAHLAGLKNIEISPRPGLTLK